MFFPSSRIDRKERRRQMENKFEYETPKVVDYGDIKEITETNLKVANVDLPLGTPTTGLPLGSNF
jgi:hypothetical protein